MTPCSPNRALLRQCNVLTGRDFSPVMQRAYTTAHLALALLVGERLGAPVNDAIVRQLLALQGRTAALPPTTPLQAQRMGLTPKRRPTRVAGALCVAPTYAISGHTCRGQAASRLVDGKVGSPLPGTQPKSS
jgi:hypothetical protein